MTVAGAGFLAGAAPLFAAVPFLATPAPGGVGRVSSLELQLEIPKAASSESTRMVNAIRAGVHNRFPLFACLFACISYLLPDTHPQLKHTIQTTLM